MLLDINQLWPQDVHAVQDIVQVQGLEKIQRPQSEYSAQNQEHAAQTSQSRAEQCFSDFATCESQVIKTNHSKENNHQKHGLCEGTTTSLPKIDKCQDTIEYQPKSSMKPLSSQAVIFK